jgi:hypothetical protein
VVFKKIASAVLFIALILFNSVAFAGEAAGPGMLPDASNASLPAALTNILAQTTTSYAPAPSGGDDATALQAWFNAIPNNGIGVVSGTYNLCSAHLVVPADGNTRTLEGGGTIRIQPACGSPPTEVLYENNTNTASRLHVRDITWDAYCLAAHDINISAGHAVDIESGLIRNATNGGGGGGSNILLGGGSNQSYEHVIGSAVRIENENDAGHTCYNSFSDFPQYNLDVESKATDNIFAGFKAANAAQANINDVSGGNNNYTATHPFNFFNGGSASFLPPYNFQITNLATLHGVYADTAATAGIHLSGGTGGQQVVGGKAFWGNTGGPPSGAAGVLIDANVPNALVTGFQALQLNPSLIVEQAGTPSPSTLVYGNPGALYSAPGPVRDNAGVYLSLAGNPLGSGNLTTSGSTASGSYTIVLASLPSTVTLGAVSKGNSGNRLPDGATILNINTGTSTITVSSPTTGTINTGTALTFNDPLELCPTSPGGQVFVTTPFSMQSGCAFLPTTGLSSATQYYIYATLLDPQVSAAASNGIASGPLAGAVRLTVSSTAGLFTGESIVVAGINGTTEANGTQEISVVDGTHVDLYGTTFVNTYNYGGEIDAVGLSAATTGYALATSGQTVGLRTESGNTTETLVGMAATASGPIWRDSNTSAGSFDRWVISWYNQQTKTCEWNLGSDQTPSQSTAYAYVVTTKCNFLTWGQWFTPLEPPINNQPLWSITGAADNATIADTCETTIGFDSGTTGETAQSLGTSAVAASVFPISAGSRHAFTSGNPAGEGEHTAGLLGASPAGTCTWKALTSLRIDFPG